MKRFTLLLALVALIAVPEVAQADDLPTPQEIELVLFTRMNEERVARGLNPVVLDDNLSARAREHSERMRAVGRAHHNPKLGSVTASWGNLGENVGSGGTAETLHRAFMNSPGHCRSILSNFERVGIGAVILEEWKPWVTVIFMNPLPSRQTATHVSDCHKSMPEGVGATVVDTRRGLWYAPGHDAPFYYGNPGDYPMVGDWDCDGVATPGLYRQSDGYVYLRNSNTQGIGDIRFYFGNPDDVPIAGDFNGDGCDTVSLYRPAEARFYIIDRLGDGEQGLGRAETEITFGNRGDTPLAGDWDGDGIDTIGVYRKWTDHEGKFHGEFHLRNSHAAGAADIAFESFGEPQMVPIAGDWKGRGQDGVGLYNPSNGKVSMKDEPSEGRWTGRYPAGFNATVVS